MDLKIFVDTDSDIRLARRIERDVYERGRDVQGILQQYARFVKPAFENFIHPTMKFADVIIPRGKENLVAIELITQNILCQLEARGIDVRQMLNWDFLSSDLPPKVSVLPSSGQLRALHTILRNLETHASDFNFYSDRLSSLVIEWGLRELPHFEKIVETPCGKKYHGAECTEHFCGVVVLPSGATMEAGFRRTCKNIHVGQILTQSCETPNQIEISGASLPDDLQEKIVFFMDSTVTSGESAVLAIKLLKDKGVSESNIIFLCQNATLAGLHVITKAYPELRIIVSEVGDGFHKKFHVQARDRLMDRNGQVDGYTF
ncbi:hypothetical protein HMI55_001182 [Coelomomyces lativittatus]|nr:hypothetical protein HMI55_001182 [Coelomomyces lativittatus]